ncbi:MAG: response regulator [Ferruginibacter sp.]
MHTNVSAFRESYRPTEDQFWNEPKESSITCTNKVERVYTDNKQLPTPLSNTEDQLEFKDILLHIANQFINFETEDLDALLADVLKIVGLYFNTDRTYIFNIDWKKRVVNNTHEWTQEGVSSERENLQAIPIHSIRVFIDELSKGNNIHIPDTAALPIEWKPIQDILEAQHILSLLVMPITFKKKLIGFVGFDAVRHKRNWTVSEESLMQVLADYIASALMRKQAANDLIRAKKVAEEASLSKSEFLANMSHEIRTPLNGVIGFTDLLMKTKLDENQQQYMNTVYQSANSLLDIINDVLDFSKIEAGKLELLIEKTDVMDIASQVSDMIKFQAHKKGLEMLLNIDGNVPRYIWADAIRLRQILVNLLGNAIKFTQHGEIELKIETIHTTPEQNTFRFSVRDTGIGIALENQQKIFEAFSQEDSSTTRNFGGTGLGLTISNKLLALMDSQLRLHSIMGKGSCFYFDVNFKAENGDAEEWVNNHQIEKALIVDDNQNNRAILKAMLSLQHIETREAKNGIEAIEILKTGERFDVVFMDYHMPYFSGIDTIKNIRQELQLNSEMLPIILLHSAAENEQLLEVCKTLEIHEHLIKPIKLRGLYKSLAKLTAQNTCSEHIADSAIEPIHQYGKYTLLIVEDNAINMLLARAIIQNISSDIKIIEAVNGREGIEKFIQHSPDLIFMDIQMPDISGYEAATKIRSMNTQVPIIALTAGTLQGERDRCIDAGMNDYISKPLIASTIEAAIKQYLLPVSTSTCITYNKGKFNALKKDYPSFLKDQLIRTKQILEEQATFIISGKKKPTPVWKNQVAQQMIEVSRQFDFKEILDFGNEWEVVPIQSKRLPQLLFESVFQINQTIAFIEAELKSITS